MMGCLYDPDCAWPSLGTCSGPAPCFESSPWARGPTPAATAPRTEVFTKSRREKVMHSSCLLESGKHITRQMAFHHRDTEAQRSPKNGKGNNERFSLCLCDSVVRVWLWAVDFSEGFCFSDA